MHEASRTLVKSPPELWAECSDAAALARHLGGFGEIRITRLDPETAVAWEGENVRGTVRIEPSGWGTKVVLTAEQAVEGVPPPEPVGVTEPVVEAVEPVGVTEPVVGAVEPAGVTEPVVEAVEPAELASETPAVRQRRFARLRAFFRGAEPLAADGLAEPEPVVAVQPEPPAPEPLAPEPPAPEPLAPEPLSPVDPAGAEAALAAALDSLGQAHHRPFSRA
jgi:hypothetical protein